jgi:hypothetical protein
MHIPLQQSSTLMHGWPFAAQPSSLENWIAQGKRKSLQAAAWKTVSAAFVSTDASCSRFSSTPPTPLSSSRAASVTRTATTMMQAMTSRRSVAVGTLEVVIGMIAKSFSLNTHSTQNACKRNAGSMEGRKDGRERQRDCEKLWRDWESVRFYWHTAALLHTIVTVRAKHTVHSSRASPKTSTTSWTVTWRKMKNFIQHFLMITTILVTWLEHAVAHKQKVENFKLNQF